MIDPERAALARRVQRFERAMYDRVVTRTEPLPFGLARLTPDILLVFDLSCVEVTRPVAPGELLPVVDALFERFSLGHRKIETARPEVAWTLTPTLVDWGWQASQLTFMVHDRTTSGRVSALPTSSGNGFDVVDLDTWAQHCPAFTADNPWGQGADVQAAMVSKDRRIAATIDTTFILSSDGRASAHIYRHGQIAEIEEVRVLSEARGEGLGQGVMARAMAECGDAEVVFLIADAEDWPLEWYRRLGFTPVCTRWQWIRFPEEQGGAAFDG